MITKPYFLAYKKRNQYTEGDEEDLESIKKEIEELEGQYQKRSRDLNRDLKEIYNKSKKETEDEKALLLMEAQKKARKKVDEANQSLKTSLESLRKDISSEVDSVSDEIIKKVLH